MYKSSVVDLTAVVVNARRRKRRRWWRNARGLLWVGAKDVWERKRVVRLIPTQCHVYSACAMYVPLVISD